CGPAKRGSYTGPASSSIAAASSRPPGAGKVADVEASPPGPPLRVRLLKLCTHQSVDSARVATAAGGTSASDSGGNRGSAAGGAVSSTRMHDTACNPAKSPSIGASAALSAL